MIIHLATVDGMNAILQSRLEVSGVAKLLAAWFSTRRRSVDRRKVLARRPIQVHKCVPSPGMRRANSRVVPPRLQ